MHLPNDLITYQTRVTRNLVMHSRAMLICGVREDLDASRRRSTRCRLLLDRTRVKEQKSYIEKSYDGNLISNLFVKESLIENYSSLDLTYTQCQRFIQS